FQRPELSIFTRCRCERFLWRWRWPIAGPRRPEVTMRQALHILRKDVRRLWLMIAIVLSLTVICSVKLAMEPLLLEWDTFQNNFHEPIMFVIAVAWVCLVAMIVYGEPLVGSRQFWITRPYSWRSLLAAKVLLILAVVNLPVLASDLFIILYQGLSPASALQNLLGRQLALLGLFLLPALGIASITRNLGQFVAIALLLTIGALLAWILAMGQLGATWSRWTLLALNIAITAAGMSVGAILQFARRQTIVACCVAGASVAAGVLIAEVQPPLKRD